MPIIDVSQHTYRTLLKAAHSQGMSVDRFIQLKFGENAKTTEVADVGRETSPLPFSPAEAPSSHRKERPREDRHTGADQVFDALWERIRSNAGDPVRTKRGNDFTYEVEPGYLTVVESGARIPKSQFKKALSQWPQSGPSNMRGVYGASFVWALLADERILEAAA